MGTVRSQTGTAISGVVIAISVVTNPAPLMAQTSLMEEIQVTAQRREELVQDIPLAVTAYSADQLKALQVVESKDVGQLVPNLLAHSNTGPGTSLNYSLRGLNNTESIATFDPPVGTYVDDIYIARQNANNLQFFDVERIEVLRGPQGTLFGRNTTGGAVRAIMRKPSEELGGFVEGGYGEYERIDIRGSLDVPVSDQFLTKLSAYYIEDDGWVDNLTTGETLNQQEAFGIRGDVRWLITEALSWDFAVEYAEDDHPNLLNLKDGSSRIANTGIPSSGTPIIDSGLTVAGSKASFALSNDTENIAVYSTIDWDTAIGTVSFITGWRELEQNFFLDFADVPTPVGGFSIANEGEHEQFSQELKLAGSIGEVIDYVAGVFYFDEDNTTDFADIVPGLVLNDRILKNTTEALAFYVQADYHINDQWTTTVGVRYTDEDKDIDYADNTGGNLTTAAIEALGIATKQNEQLWTPRFAVQWAPNDDQMYYASATRGFKSGGWNARGGTANLITPFSSEINWTYELGGRSQWIDDRLRLNWTLFWSDTSDFQLPSSFPDPADPTGNTQVFLTGNFADLENKGIEVEITATPVDRVNLIVNIGIQDGEYSTLSQEVRDQQADCLNNGVNCGRGIVKPDGSIAIPVRTPDYTLTVGGNYTWPITANLDLIPGAFLYTIGEHSIGTNEVIVDGYTTFNASLALAHDAQDWRLIFECKNCNDRTMPVSSFVGLYLQDPRTWRLSFYKGFGRN